MLSTFADPAFQRLALSILMLGIAGSFMWVGLRRFEAEEGFPRPVRPRRRPSPLRLPLYMLATVALIGSLGISIYQYRAGILFTANPLDWVDSLLQLVSIAAFFAARRL